MFFFLVACALVFFSSFLVACALIFFGEGAPGTKLCAGFGVGAEGWGPKPRKSGGPEGGGAKGEAHRGLARRVGAKNSRLFSLSRRNFRLSSLSGCLLVELCPWPTQEALKGNPSRLEATLEGLPFKERGSEPAPSVIMRIS